MEVRCQEGFWADQKGHGHKHRRSVDYESERGKKLRLCLVLKLYNINLIFDFGQFDLISIYFLGQPYNSTTRPIPGINMGPNTVMGKVINIHTISNTSRDFSTATTKNGLERTIILEN